MRFGMRLCDQRPALNGDHFRRVSRYCLRENRLLVVSCAIVYDPSFFDDELPLISSINMISEGSGILDARGEEAAEIE